MPHQFYELYHAFTESRFGGSPAAIIEAPDLDDPEMQRIAARIGAPATCFVVRCDEDCINVRFFSPLTEYPMCGHGTIALGTWLVEKKKISLVADIPKQFTLRTPDNTAELQLCCLSDKRLLVTMSLPPAATLPFQRSTTSLISAFGAGSGVLSQQWGIMLTVSDFRSLIIPIVGLREMDRLRPDFRELAVLSRDWGIDTIALFTKETRDSKHGFHMREFCPALGSNESAATGTTNRALMSYLFENSILSTTNDDPIRVVTEQGYEMGRPSQVNNELRFTNGQLSEIRVGGFAKIVDAKEVSY